MVRLTRRGYFLIESLSSNRGNGARGLPAPPWQGLQAPGAWTHLVASFSFPDRRRIKRPCVGRPLMSAPPCTWSSESWTRQQRSRSA